MDDPRYDKSEISSKSVILLVLTIAFVGISCSFFWALVRRSMVNDYLSKQGSSEDIQTSTNTSSTKTFWNSSSERSSSTSQISDRNISK